MEISCRRSISNVPKRRSLRGFEGGDELIDALDHDGWRSVFESLRALSNNLWERERQPMCVGGPLSHYVLGLDGPPGYPEDGSHFEGRPLAPGDHLGMLAERPGLVEEPVQRLVIVIRVMVKQREPAHASQLREGDGVGDAAVAPAHALGVLRCGVLPVVEQEVDVRRHVVARSPRRIASDPSQPRLVIRQIGHGRTVMGNAIAEGRTRVDDGSRGHAEGADPPWGGRRVVELDPRVQVADADWEQRRRKVAGQPAAEVERR